MTRRTVEVWRSAEFRTTGPSGASLGREIGGWSTFERPDGGTVRQPVFWDGGDEWAVRVAPTMPGTWRYEFEGAGLADSGVFEAVPYSGDLELFRRGFVRVSDDRRGFAYDDGTPFLWLGDTHWQAPNYERLHECNHPQHGGVAAACGGQFRHAADRVAEQGFTVYQTYPDATLTDGGGNRSQVDWWSERYERLDPAAFREQFDPIMGHLADRGLVIALGMGVHWQSARVGAEAMRRFAAYVTARYAAHPVVWITGQEVDVEQGLGTLPVWRAVAETIRGHDGHLHPLGAHMDSVGEPTTFGSEPWHDWFPTQGGHGRIRSAGHYRVWWDREPATPFLETEANYEALHWQGEILSAADVRRSAWRAVLCGSRGFTYGAAGTWAMKWDAETPGWDDYHALPWFEGLELPGRAQLGVLAAFLRSLDAWHRLSPAFGDPTLVDFAHPELAVLAVDGATRVAYFSGDAGDLETGTLLGLDRDAPVVAAWLDPRDGSRHPLGSIDPRGGSWRMPPAPDERDWVLLVGHDHDAGAPAEEDIAI